MNWTGCALRLKLFGTLAGEPKELRPNSSRGQGRSLWAGQNFVLKVFTIRPERARSIWNGGPILSPLCPQLLGLPGIEED